jgi:hypothetical protein
LCACVQLSQGYASAVKSEVQSATSELDVLRQRQMAADLELTKQELAASAARAHDAQVGLQASRRLSTSTIANGSAAYVSRPEVVALSSPAYARDYYGGPGAGVGVSGVRAPSYPVGSALRRSDAAPHHTLAPPLSATRSGGPMDVSVSAPDLRSLQRELREASENLRVRFCACCQVCHQR